MFGIPVVSWLNLAGIVILYNVHTKTYYNEASEKKIIMLHNRNINTIA